MSERDDSARRAGESAGLSVSGVETDTQTIGKIDTFHIEELCGDIEIPCDYMMDPNTTCPGDKAEWVLFLVRCECGQGGTALACDTCAQYRMASDGAVECSGCGEVTAPARLAYSYIEAIKKPFA